MIITQLIPFSKEKVKVYIDMEFAFVLYKGELRHFGIKEDKEITPDNFDEIKKVLLPKRAKLRCLNLLKARNYTQKTLEDKLRDGAYSSDIIEEAISYVKSYGYIDDERYALSYIDAYIAQKSRKKIEYDLMQKGVEKALIQKAFWQWEEENEEDSKEKENLLIQKLLEKKKYDAKNATKEEKNKIMAYLYRRGFSYEQIAVFIQNV